MDRIGGAQDIGIISFGVSADGSTAVGYQDGPNGSEAYRWTESGGAQGLGFLSTISGASDVSADGNTVVGSGNGGAFIWTPDTGMTNLATTGPLNEPFFGQPNAISADGSTVVGVVGPSPEAWIWTETSGLQFLGISQAAYGASADGSVVIGGSQFSRSSGIAWIYDKTNGVRDLKTVFENDYGLDLTGWNLYAALDISDDGTKFTGVGINPMGQQEAWYADISAVPVPAAAWLFGSGLVGLIGLARRKA